MPRLKSTHVDDPKLVGQRLREAREAAGLTQRDLSFPGCTAAYVSSIERGSRIPSYQLLRELGKRLGVSADYLATGERSAALDEVAEGELMLRLGETERAELLFANAAESAEAGARAAATVGLGILASERGRLSEAIELLRQAKELDPAAWRAHPSAAEALVRCLALRGLLEEAIALCEEALSSLTADERLARERYLVLLANALIDTGAFDRATEVLGGALSEAGLEGDPLRFAKLLWSQSRLHTARGEHDLAAAFARRALGAIEATEFVAYAARARQVLAYIENERGQPERALELLDEGWPTMERAGDPYLRVVYELEQARALSRLHREDEARELAIRVMSAVEGLGSVDAARAMATVADVLAAAGDERALDAYATAAAELEALSSPLAREVYVQWANLLEHLGRSGEAFAVLKRTLAIGRGAAHT